MIDSASQRSADHVTFARELIKGLNDSESQNASLLLNKMSKVDATQKLLSYALVPNKVVGVIQLEDGRRRQSIQHMNEVWNGSAWILFNPETGTNQHIRIFWCGMNPTSLYSMWSVANSQVMFSMISQKVTPQQATDSKVEADGLLNLSIHSLPLEEQAMFKTIMLIPIGALIVVFLRVIVGLKTSGTFMPVLIAVAFVQTSSPRVLSAFC